MSAHNKPIADAAEDRVGDLAALPGLSTTAEVTRIFHRWPGHEVGGATRMLARALDSCRAYPSTRMILSGAGLVWYWKESNKTAQRRPSEEEFEEFQEQARQQAALIRDRLKLRPDDPAILLGIDIYATCNRCADDLPVGQFAALIRPGDAPVELVAKGLPMANEARFVFVPEDGCRTFDSPLMPSRPSAALVCNDISAWSNRGAATSSRDVRLGWREKIEEEIEQARRAGLRHAFHLVHCMHGGQTFTAAYNQWMNDVKVPLVGASGLAKSVTSEQQVQEIARALKRPGDFETYDMWELP